MTNEQALDIIERHKGRIEADYNCPELDDEIGVKRTFMVTLRRPPHFGKGASAGGDTLVEATNEALCRLDETKPRGAESDAQETP